MEGLFPAGDSNNNPLGLAELMSPSDSTASCGAAEVESVPRSFSFTLSIPFASNFVVGGLAIVEARR